MEDYEEEKIVEKDKKVNSFERVSNLQKLIKEESTLSNLCKSSYYLSYL